MAVKLFDYIKVLKYDLLFSPTGHLGQNTGVDIRESEALFALYSYLANILKSPLTFIATFFHKNFSIWLDGFNIRLKEKIK